MKRYRNPSWNFSQIHWKSIDHESYFLRVLWKNFSNFIEFWWVLNKFGTENRSKDSWKRCEFYDPKFPTSMSFNINLINGEPKFGPKNRSKDSWKRCEFYDPNFPTLMSFQVRERLVNSWRTEVRAQKSIKGPLKSLQVLWSKISNFSEFWWVFSSPRTRKAIKRLLKLLWVLQ